MKVAITGKGGVGTTTLSSTLARLYAEEGRMVLASDIAKDWGINISQVPVVGCAPEWMSEKAVSIGNYVVATGIETFLGVDPYSKGSTEVTELLQGETGIKEWVEAKFVVDTDIESLGDKMIACIEAKRAALGI